jgi:hypothetical protein
MATIERPREVTVRERIAGRARVTTGHDPRVNVLAEVLVIGLAAIAFALYPEPIERLVAVVARPYAEGIASALTLAFFAIWAVFAIRTTYVLRRYR